MSEKAGLDALDRRILDIIQGNFPLESRPYAVLGKQAGVSELEAFERVEKMRASGLIRRLGANFQSAKIGFTSTLCAAKVPPEKLESFISLVNAQPGVTHNYERQHEYNIWFTLISPSCEEALALLNDLSEKSGIPILNVPATHFYKIKVDFSMSGE